MPLNLCFEITVLFHNERRQKFEYHYTFEVNLFHVNTRSAAVEVALATAGQHQRYHNMDVASKCHTKVYLNTGEQDRNAPKDWLVCSLDGDLQQYLSGAEKGGKEAMVSCYVFPTEKLVEENAVLDEGLLRSPPLFQCGCGSNPCRWRGSSFEWEASLDHDLSEDCHMWTSSWTAERI